MPNHSLPAFFEKFEPSPSAETFLVYLNQGKP